MPGFVWLTVVVFLFGSSASDSKSDGGTTAAQCTMKDTTGPVVVTEDGAVVENLRIRYNGTAAALTVTSASNVVLRNLAIEHSTFQIVAPCQAPLHHWQNEKDSCPTASIVKASVTLISIFSNLFLAPSHLSHLSDARTWRCQRSRDCLWECRQFAD